MSRSLTLVIGNKNYSSWSLRPWLLMRHHGILFDEIRLPLDTPEFERGVARLSPSRRVPVLHDGELVVWDSLAISEYVSETLLGGAGWPADPARRAVARSVSAEMHSGFQALRNALPLNCRRRVPGFVVPADAAGDIDRIARIWRECRERAADGPFLFGAFSIADAMYAPVVMRFNTYAPQLSREAAAYAARVSAEPAVAAWIEAARKETHRIEHDEPDA